MRRSVLASTPLFLAASCAVLAPHAQASVINTVISTPSVGSGPSGLAVSPTGANAGDVYATNYNGNTVSVIDPSNAVIATIPVGDAPYGVAVSPTGANAGDVYVTNESDGTVSVISPSNTVIATVTVGSSPSAVAVSPTGANAGDVHVPSVWAGGRDIVVVW